MTRADFDTIMSAVAQMLQEQRVPLATHGVASQSWSAVDNPPQVFAGTVGVTVGKTAAIIGPDNDQFDKDTGYESPSVHVASTAIGDQYAPRGGERTVMLHTENGPVAVFMHGSDDTNPGIIPGERWICHRNAAGTVDAYVKWRNDGKAANDGLASLVLLAGALASISTTGFANAIIVDDATATVQFAGSGNAADDGIVRKSDLRAAINALAMIVQGGSGVTPPTVTASTKTFTA